MLIRSKPGKFQFYFVSQNLIINKYRLFHGRFHIGPGFIPRLPYQPKAIAEGLYGSRDETRADMENVMF
jgi:hypothetical protein